MQYAVSITICNKRFFYRLLRFNNNKFFNTNYSRNITRDHSYNNY